jgi:outer membrane lipoprotein SlyB
MKAHLAAISLFAVLAVVSAPASAAKGCVKGAVVGGVVGHVAGHHALIGAAAGCAIGVHRDHKAERRQTAHRHLQKRDVAERDPG